MGDDDEPRTVMYEPARATRQEAEPESLRNQKLQRQDAVKVLMKEANNVMDESRVDEYRIESCARHVSWGNTESI